MSWSDYIPVIGPVIDYFSQKDTNRTNRGIADATSAANAQQAKAQMDFQERMSNTAYQRAMADMKAAGINPMLAATVGGSSTPPGASVAAQIGASYQSPGHSLAKLSNSAVQIMRNRLELDNLRDANVKLRSDASLNKAMERSANMETQIKTSNAFIARMNAENLAHLQAGIRTEGEIDESRFGKMMRYLGRLNPLSSMSSSAKNTVSLFR